MLKILILRYFCIPIIILLYFKIFIRLYFGYFTSKYKFFCVFCLFLYHIVSIYIYYIKKNLKVNYLSKDDSFNLDDSTNIYVLSPSYITDNNNSNSIVLNISYKNNNFLFTGDCEESNEMDMINSYNLEDIDFLKVAHHGSYTASSLAFLEETTPDIAVISCGYKNSYGHPHKSTLDNLESVDAKIFRTDQNGSMQFYSDGEKIYSKVKYKEYKWK